MRLLDQKNHKYIITGIIISLMIFTFWIRYQNYSALFPTNSTFLLGGEPDISYNIRAAEQMISSGKYAWFDAMTFFPTGDTIYWGPLFTYIIVLLCSITGAATRFDIIHVASFIPPLIAVAMVPILYYIGKFICDSKTGIISAIMIATVGGQYFSRSIFGNVDHHIAEVLFSTLFCLSYIIAIKYTNEQLKNFTTLQLFDKKKLIMIFLVSAGSSISYLLGYFTMPTIIMFALIISIYTGIQFFIDSTLKKNSLYLLVVNTIVFGIAATISLITAQHPGISLELYSFGHALAYTVLIVMTGVLYILSRKYSGLASFAISVAITFVVIMISMAILLPDLYRLFFESPFYFFAQSPQSNTVLEARAWDFTSAFSSYNFGLVSIFLGIFALGYYTIRDKNPHEMFVIIWSIFVIFATNQHVRYEYYASVSIALLAAVSLGFAIEVGWNQLYSLVKEKVRVFESTENIVNDEVNEKKSKRTMKKEKKREVKKKQPTAIDRYSRVVVFAMFAIPCILFIPASVISDNYISSNFQYALMEPPWRTTLEWFGNNSPDTGVNYYNVYQKNNFTYPPTAYGVMSWWDYGHWITFFSKRIPNANPFQHGVAGPYGAAAYFMQQDENRANEILNKDGTKYVITDVEMSFGKFWAMATWYNTTLSASPYYVVVYTQENVLSPRQLQQFYTQNYYESMIARLHNFDGSHVNGTPIVIILKPQPNAYPLVVNGLQFPNITSAMTYVNNYNSESKDSSLAAVIGVNPTITPVDIKALQHYRLVYESPEVATGTIHYVKIFEYVNGSRVSGNGTASINVTTNTGRTFTYRQQSTDGVFILPYDGEYRIEETNTTFFVSGSSITS